MNGDEMKVFQPEFKPDIAVLMQQAQFANGSQRGGPPMIDPSLVNVGGAQLYGAGFGVGPMRIGGAAAPNAYGGMQSGALPLGLGATMGSPTSSHPLVTSPKAETGAYRDLTLSNGGPFTPAPSEQFGAAAGGSGIGVGSTPPGSACAVPTGGMSKYQCAICGDRASGKHYGVFSCEGCKGFFKRTVRKDLTYSCRDERNCPIDKRQRNRCQYCRYNRCLAAGMKREAVQEERLRAKEKTVTSNCSDAIDFQRVLQAELATEPCEAQEYTPLRPAAFANANGRPVDVTAIVNGSNGEAHAPGVQPSLVVAADRQLYMLVEWAKRLPHFGELPLDDQIALLRAGWNELLIAAFAFRSTQLADQDALLIANGVQVRRDAAHALGVGAIFDRVLVELVAKMREMKLDRIEVGCLRAIILFNADVKSLQSVVEVEAAREKYYLTLEEYCKATYPSEPTRFAKILLRMPALRSIGLKCLEHLFFFKLLGDSPADSFLAEMLNETLQKNADDHLSSPPLPPAGAGTAAPATSAVLLCAPPAAGQSQSLLSSQSPQQPPQNLAGGPQTRLGFVGGGVNSLGTLNAGY